MQAQALYNSVFGVVGRSQTKMDLDVSFGHTPLNLAKVAKCVIDPLPMSDRLYNLKPISGNDG